MHHSKNTLIKLNRSISWGLFFVTLLLLITGYAQTRLSYNREIIMPLHFKLGYLFGFLLLVHFALSFMLFRMDIFKITKNLGPGSSSWVFVRSIQRISSLLLLFSGIAMFLSGLGWERFVLGDILNFSLHVKWDIMVTILLSIHILTGLKSALARNKITFALKNKGFFILILLIIISVTYLDLNLGKGTRINVGFPSGEISNINNTKPMTTGSVSFEYSNYGKNRKFIFDATTVETLRPDILKQGYFSMFDVLVHIVNQNEIDFNYHFDEKLDTYIIDSLDGKKNWWYIAYYDGGWRELNNYRMDHYPWKDKSTLIIYETSQEKLEVIYNIFRDEVTRKNHNDGKTIIPFVKIDGLTFTETFENVEIYPHNLRDDIFQEDVITAIDVILSLADQGKLNYTLQWYESIGRAKVVKDYWVESINGDKTENRCGFVYEAGSLIMMDKRGNHIHIPSDIRPIISPEYEWWFYICI